MKQCRHSKPTFLATFFEKTYPSKSKTTKVSTKDAIKAVANDTVKGETRFVMFAVSAIGAILFAGCHLGQPASASFASVVIPGKSQEDICTTTAAVFQEDGYQVGALNPDNMVFQKEGSRGQSLAYGGVVDTHYGASTMTRVRAQLVDLGAGSYRLQCQASVVRNANDALFEDESRLANIRSGPYQSLLNKVAERLK